MAANSPRATLSIHGGMNVGRAPHAPMRQTVVRVTGAASHFAAWVGQDAETQALLRIALDLKHGVQPPQVPVAAAPVVAAPVAAAPAAAAANVERPATPTGQGTGLLVAPALKRRRR